MRNRGIGREYRVSGDSWHGWEKHKKYWKITKTANSKTFRPGAVDQDVQASEVKWDRPSWWHVLIVLRCEFQLPECVPHHQKPSDNAINMIYL